MLVCRLDPSLITVNISGPDLPIELWGHSMVVLGLGQVIIGGYDSNFIGQSKIYHLKCSQHNWDVTVLVKELSIPRGDFMAITIPDKIAGCISESKFRFFWGDIFRVKPVKQKCVMKQIEKNYMLAQKQIKM